MDLFVFFLKEKPVKKICSQKKPQILIKLVSTVHLKYLST